MSSTFWIGDSQLDDYQRDAVQGIPETESFLLTGPAGSGKTNILLLRAKWLTLKKKTNYKIVVFTKSLRKFVEEGCMHYDIDQNCAVTQMAFFKDILRECSVSFDATNNFEDDRTMLAGKVMSLIEEEKISNEYYGSLLIDEAQDYTDTELRAFRGLTKNLVLASDSRQSIYKTTHTPGLLETLVNKRVVNLRYHYRSGLKLCKVADAILADKVAYPRVQTDCQYPEARLPSSVVVLPCDSFEDQIDSIIGNIESQLSLYPGEKIGVLFPRNDQLSQFSEKLFSSSLRSDLQRVWSDTLHGAKGWEFRAVHIGGCEALSRMGHTQKRLIYTGILRGKTSVHLYYSGRVPGYLDEALAVLEPPRADPEMDELFRGK